MLLVRCGCEEWEGEAEGKGGMGEEGGREEWEKRGEEREERVGERDGVKREEWGKGMEAKGGGVVRGRKNEKEQEKGEIYKEDMESKCESKEVNRTGK